MVKLGISSGNPPGLTTVTEIILRVSNFLEHHLLHLFHLRQDTHTTTFFFRNWKTFTSQFAKLRSLKIKFASIIRKLLNSKGLLRSKRQFQSFAKYTLKGLKFPKLPALASASAFACSSFVILFCCSKCLAAKPSAYACTRHNRKADTCVKMPTVNQMHLCCCPVPA